MYRKLGVFAAALLLGLGAAGQAFAQADGLDVTLEVLDDVADHDVVVLNLEDVDRVEDGRAEDQDRRSDGDVAVDRERERERDEIVERDDRENVLDREIDERRADAVEDRELERDRDELLTDEEIVEETDVVVD